ncbi:hypothetical protein CSQ88_09165 [Iodobacter sp. BJB302]|nr:hypothetical protein CSQ88_09165 [Iodobacter sp. BJB302]
MCKAEGRRNGDELRIKRLKSEQFKIQRRQKALPHANHFLRMQSELTRNEPHDIAVIFYVQKP